MYQHIVVASYNHFDWLPHKPRGEEAEDTLTVLRLDCETGELTKIAARSDVGNPAYARIHPNTGKFYMCTETIKEHGEMVMYSLSSKGELEEIQRQDAEGMSTCYLTFDKALSNMFVINYWDSHIPTIPLTPQGAMSKATSVWKPAQKVVARGLEDHLRERQSEPHAHCIELDPVHKRVAYVPDLGLDVVRQFVLDQETGSLTHDMDIAVAAGKRDGAFGPRYIEFHPSLPCAYLVNELSSTLSVFEFDADRAGIIKAGDKQPTLKLVQESPILPQDFNGKNTCGRVHVHPTGKFVLTSNRGHDSITVHRVDTATGRVERVNTYSTRGNTPRHFALDTTGNFVLAANQDSGTVEVFRINLESGELIHTGHSAAIKSPNFILSEGLPQYS